MRLFVKVCGITRQEDANLAAELGADALGFIFWPGSPRFIDPHEARTIVRSLPPFVSAVGVFVDQPIDYVEEVASLVGLSAVQLHGNESIEYCLRIRHRVIKAASLEKHAADSLVELPRQMVLLLDAHDPTRHGGTGRTVDWMAARRVAASRPAILSGGLTANNVAAALEAVQPYGVDVSSGVESAPGRKDRQRLLDFFAALRTASPTFSARRTFGRRDPDARGYFGVYGGRFVPETLVAPVEELERAYLDVI